MFHWTDHICSKMNIYVLQWAYMCYYTRTYMLWGAHICVHCATICWNDSTYMCDLKHICAWFATYIHRMRCISSSDLPHICALSNIYVRVSFAHICAQKSIYVRFAPTYMCCGVNIYLLTLIYVRTYMLNSAYICWHIYVEFG